jgi:ATP-dependent RNA helicase DeaD
MSSIKTTKKKIETKPRAAEEKKPDKMPAMTTAAGKRKKTEIKEPSERLTQAGPSRVEATAMRSEETERPQERLVAETTDLVEPAQEAAAFRALNLSEPVMRAIIEAGFEAPTPIQEQAIPILLAGRDLIGQAQTGTGKTAAFALPLAERLDAAQRSPQAIILLPTRELCIQVAQDTHNLSKHCRLRVVPIYGGQPIDRQFRALSMGAHIVVGTPGRVLDHLRRGTLDLSQVKVVILDEADEMLNMGFLEDVEEILKEAPKERQTALFSATMPPRIVALARDYLQEPQRVAIESKHRTVAQVEQTYYEVVPSQKVEALARILDMESPGSTILFCRTRREVDELGESLQTRGYEAETLHGEMNQAARDRVMNRFRSGQADLLIATDVAARGLDIDQVTHVINYDIPWDVESYVHRIGRTGRAGRSGEAITLISPRERYQLRLIERYINTPIRPARVPTTADIAARRREMFKDRLRQTLSEGGSDSFLMTVEELTEEGEYDASQIAAAALQLLWQGQKGASDYDIAEAKVSGERSEQGMTRLFLQIGRQDGIRPGDIVGAIANEAGVPGNAIGAIDIMDRSTFVEVPEADAARVMEALSRTKLRGKKVYVDVARPRREFEPGSRPPGFGERDRGVGGYRDADRGERRRFDDRPSYGRDERFSRPAPRHGGKAGPDNGTKHPRKKP